MPEATVLYTVTAVVVLGLVVWVAVVLKTAREPWARPHLERQSGIESVPPAKGEERPSSDVRDPEAEAAARDSAKVGADSTAKATPAALASESKPRDGAKDEGDAEA